MESLNVNEIDNDGVNELCAAAIQDACKDYVKYKQKLYLARELGSLSEPIYEKGLKEVTNFFRSKWFEQLNVSNINSEKIINRLDEKYEQWVKRHEISIRRARAKNN